MLPLTRSRNRARFFGIPFSPYKLFAAGEQGAWYDPSDFSTLFQDSTGVTPVTGVEQFVGLMLDKSKGLVLGNELVTNGDFSGGSTGWTLAASWSVASGIATKVAGVTDAIQQNISLVQGKHYKVTISAVAVTGGSATIRMGNNSTVLATISANGDYEFILTPAGTNGIFYVYGNGTFGGSIDNISVRELPGNHAFQTSSAKRPKLAARYNLLTYTEEFDNGAWTKGGGGSVTITPNTNIAPNGTLAADTINCVTGATAIWTAFTSSSLVAGTYVLSCSVLKGKSFNLTLDDASANGAGVYFDGTTGVGTNVFLGSGWSILASSCVTHPSDSNWWLASATIVRPTTTASSNAGIRPNVNNSATYNGNCTSGQTLVIWGADLRPASQATGLIGPTYQRVVDAAVYDTAGFLPYLAFDGLSWSMGTNSIDFSATDKMTVWAGVRKISVSSTQVICELSADTNTNNGSFLLSCSNTANRDYSFTPKGTTAPTAPAFFTPAVAPDTAVITAQADISTALGELRRNGVNGTASTGSLGSGNFLTHPLYIGARNNASLFFTGWLTSLIIRGAQSTQSQIEATESWVAGKTGVSL